MLSEEGADWIYDYAVRERERGNGKRTNGGLFESGIVGVPVIAEKAQEREQKMQKERRLAVLGHEVAGFAHNGIDILRVKYRKRSCDVEEIV